MRILSRRGPPHAGGVIRLTGNVRCLICRWAWAVRVLHLPTIGLLWDEKHDLWRRDALNVGVDRAWPRGNDSEVREWRLELRDLAIFDVDVKQQPRCDVSRYGSVKCHWEPFSDYSVRREPIEWKHTPADHPIRPKNHALH
jgi:hypothetical protein